MRSKFSLSAEIVEKVYTEIEGNYKRLPINHDIYTSPFYAKDLENIKGELIEEDKMYIADDIAFCNTSEFSKTGQYYLKNGVYTHLHPVYDKKEYDAFWDEEERRCKEGYTLPGKLYKRENGTYSLQQIHITGEHYGYLNFGEIKRSKEFSKEKGALITSNGEELAKLEAGNSKSFYLPSFWDGDYYYYKALELCRKLGRHLVIGKARRKGYSYKNAWIVVNRANLYPRTSSVIGAYDDDSLTKDGTMNKVKNYFDHINKHTDWKKGHIYSTLQHIKVGYRYSGDPTDRGYCSNIYTAVCGKDAGALRGTDSDLVLIEEAGKFPNLGEILEPTLKTLTDGVYVTGLMIVFGTGGGEDKYWQAFEDLFYETYSRDFLTFENIWDKDMQGTGCGFFHSAFMNKPGLIDIHGNSLIKQSIEYELKQRKKRENDPVKLNQYSMEEPFSPNEAFSRATNNIMPAVHLDYQLRRLRTDPDLQGIGRDGIFVQGKDRIKFIDRNSSEENKLTISPFIVDFPLKPETNVEGCVRIWDFPYRDKSGNIPDGLYRLWNDPFGISKDKEHYSIKDSLATTYVYEVPNPFTITKGDRLVAAFHGRREQTEEYDEQMFLLAQFYNAKILYENDRGDVYSNAKKRDLLEILVDEPDFQFQKSLSKGGLGRKKGISIAGNSQRKINGAIYLKNWLLEKRSEDENGKFLLNLHYIYDIGLIKELLKFDGKRNTDRSSCMIVGMYDMKQQQFDGLYNKEQEYNKTIEDDYFNLGGLYN